MSPGSGGSSRHSHICRARVRKRSPVRDGHTRNSLRLHCLWLDCIARWFGQPQQQCVARLAPGLDGMCQLVPACKAAMSLRCCPFNTAACSRRGHHNLPGAAANSHVRIADVSFGDAGDAAKRVQRRHSIFDIARVLDGDRSLLWHWDRSHHVCGLPQLTVRAPLIWFTVASGSCLQRTKAFFFCYPSTKQTLICQIRRHED